jgi:hypothetical protein
MTPPALRILAGFCAWLPGSCDGPGSVTTAHPTLNHLSGAATPSGRRSLMPDGPVT